MTIVLIANAYPAWDNLKLYDKSLSCGGISKSIRANLLVFVVKLPAIAVAEADGISGNL